ncbi:sensor histidine kinase [Paenibacillus lignilyticus]|uniref:Sensor histidine kinase n=1 Tax=Paenibacillus lignilyticus TaxID=1172615 RepID=A0ABS5C788_9BACL|nr:histidine kinase [Paenibacillus lignilyticus]MBP3961859.1 sensor histidine kinase [Paenibacillus lignilyticus]MBP3963470.1 sensor histidine kinase [Paenibacillus lignilyticus]
MGLRGLLRTGVFRKMFLGFLAVMIPFTAICYGALWVAGNALSNQAQQSAHSKLQFFMDYLQEELRNVNQMLIALNNDADMPAVYLHQHDGFDYEFVQLAGSIRAKMKIVNYSSDYVTDVFLLLPQSKIKLSVNEGVTSIGGADETILRRHMNRTDEMVRYIGNDTITYSTAVTDGSNTNVLYVLGTNLSQKRMIATMNKLDDNKKYNVFLIDDETRKRIGDADSEVLDRSIYDQLAEDETSRIQVDGKAYLVQRSTDHNFTLVSYIAESSILAPVAVIWKWYVGISISMILFAVLYSWFTYHQIHKPLHKLVRTMREVEIGNLNSTLPVSQKDEFGFVYKQFNKMVGQLRSLIEEVLESKIERQQAELKQLQSQINPHFLFNCFYIGYRMAKSGEMDQVAKLCKYLGDYFRFVTQQGSRDVALMEEIKYTRTYLEIQKMRFSNRLEFEIDIQSGLERIEVPGLLLQPLVENALLHGIERADRPGFLRITGCVEGDVLRLDVKDNGRGMENEQWLRLQSRLEKPVNSSDHFGLWNVNRRLYHLYGEESGIMLENGAPDGFTSSLRIPLCKLKQQPEAIHPFKPQNQEGVTGHVQTVDR